MRCKYINRFFRLFDPESKDMKGGMGRAENKT